MPKRQDHPKDALPLRTYEQLCHYVEAFANGHLNLLSLIGPAGVAKSLSLDQAVGKQACWIEGNATPISWGGWRGLAVGHPSEEAEGSSFSFYFPALADLVTCRVSCPRLLTTTSCSLLLKWKPPGKPGGE